MRIYHMAGCSDCEGKKKKKKTPGYTWMPKDKTHSGKMDTQMYPECEGTKYDRNIQRKNVHAQMSDVWKLESEDEDSASEMLSQIVNKAVEGDVSQQQFLSDLWGGESWDSILKKVQTEGSVWYVWWMDGVRKLLSQLDTDDAPFPQPDSSASSDALIVEAKKKKDKKDKKGKKVNPWAVCHTTVDKDKNPEKYERCVKKIKKKQAFNLNRFLCTSGDDKAKETTNRGNIPQKAKE